MNAHIFREYDIRGLVDQDLTEEVVELLGKGLGTVVRSEGRARASWWAATAASPRTRFRDALVGGLTSTGLDVLDIGVVPTPLTYFAANTLPVDGLAMITGSHNPPEYNGFKIGHGQDHLPRPRDPGAAAAHRGTATSRSGRPGTVHALRHRHPVQPLRPADRAAWAAPG